LPQHLDHSKITHLRKPPYSGCRVERQRARRVAWRPDFQYLRCRFSLRVRSSDALAWSMKPSSGIAHVPRSPLCISTFAILLLAADIFSRSTLAGDEFPAELTRFRPYEKNPVFRGAGDDAWDARIRERGWIIREGDAWRMWYTGYVGSPDAQMMLGYAT